MGWESFGVVRFDLGPLLQGQTRIAKLKSAYNSLIWLEMLCLSCFNHVPSGDTLRQEFIYLLRFYVAVNTVQVISQRVVGRQRKPVDTVGQGSVL